MLEAIGHYRIRRKIGQGAMGVVYEGWDDRLERPVAIKTISEANESNAARNRLVLAECYGVQRGCTPFFEMERSHHGS